MGGSQIWSRELDLGKLIPATTLMDYKLSFHFWARDISIFRNMFISAWGGCPWHGEREQRDSVRCLWDGNHLCRVMESLANFPVGRSPAL